MLWQVPQSWWLGRVRALWRGSCRFSYVRDRIQMADVEFPFSETRTDYGVSFALLSFLIFARRAKRPQGAGDDSSGMKLRP